MPEPVSTIPQPVAVGLSTKLGVLAAGLVPLLGALSTVLKGDQTPEALGALGVAAVALYAVIMGRSHQAAANVTAAAAVKSATLAVDGTTTTQAGAWAPSATIERSWHVSDSAPTETLAVDYDEHGRVLSTEDDGGESIAQEEGIHDHESADPASIPPDAGDVAVAGHAEPLAAEVVGK